MKIGKKTLFIFCILLMAFHFKAIEVNASSIDWKSYPMGKAIQSSTEQKHLKPFLLYFHAVWCPYCKKMNENHFKNEEIIQTSRQFYAIKIDTDNPETRFLFKKYGVQGIPTIVFLSREGKWLEDLTIKGLSVDEEGMLKQMQKALHAASKQEEL